MKLSLTSIAVLAFVAVGTPAFAQTAGATAVVCPPNGNTSSAGIVGKGNQAGAGSGTAQAGTATPSATVCPTGQGTAAASGAATASGGSIAVTPSTSNSSNSGATNK
jgi:hypothetical protein